MTKLEDQVISTTALSQAIRGSTRLWGICTWLLCHPWQRMLFRAWLAQLLALFPARKGQGSQQGHIWQEMSSSGAIEGPCAREALGWHQTGLCPSPRLSLPAGMVTPLPIPNWPAPWKHMGRAQVHPQRGEANIRRLTCI